jgi:hypothetical protein
MITVKKFTLLQLEIDLMIWAKRVAASVKETPTNAMLVRQPQALRVLLM